MDYLQILSEKEIAVILTKQGTQNKLAFACLLGYFKINIKFPGVDEHPMPLKLVSQISSELELQSDDLAEFSWDGRTAERYHQQIRNYLGYRESLKTDVEPYISYLKNEMLPNSPNNEVIIEQTRLYFEKKKLELFKDKPLQRHIRTAKKQFENDLFKIVFDNLKPKDFSLIDQVLAEDHKQLTDDIIPLADLKKDIPGARLKNINLAIQKVELLSKIKLPKLFVKQTNRKILLKYYDRILALSPSNIFKMNSKNKYAMMTIFCHIQLQLQLDGLANTFIKLIHRMRTNATKTVDDYIVGEVQRVGGKFNILLKIATVSVNSPKGTIEDTIYPQVSKEKLIAIIDDLGKRGSWYNAQIQTQIKKTYTYGNRKILLSILRAFSFKEDNPQYKPVVDAINFINKHWDDSETKNYTSIPPIENVIPDIWQAAVTSKKDDKNIINKYNYEIAVLEQLKTFLAYKAIWIQAAYLYRNPKEDLPLDFKKNKQKYLDMLGLPNKARTFTNTLKNSLTNSLISLNNTITDHNKVKIKESKIHKNLSISPSAAQKEPKNIKALQKEIIMRWSTIGLIDILKECELFMNFTDQMETITKSAGIKPEDLRKRLLLCLYGIGSNTGLMRMSIANGGVKFNDLYYVKKRFINKINVRNAIRTMVNSVLEIRDHDIWGEATTTVACDSTQVNAWDQNLLNEWHIRYKGKGVMIYWHIDKKALCIYSQLKTCSSSEVGSMMKGVIDHDTKMNMSRIFVDTHGQSVIGFAAGYILSYDLLPRFKAINKQKICGVNSTDKKKYTNIAQIMKGSLNTKKIEDNYEEVIKYMVALKLGMIEPSVLVKRFSKDNYHHPVYQALQEIGKAQRSIFLCKYLENEDLRIEINEGLNVVERMNNVMDFIFYGNLGELKTNQTDDQELSILCLHLLQVCMVYINTLLIQQILSEGHWKDRLTKEDYRALTPLLSTHINPYGLFPIDFNERIQIFNNILKEDHHGNGTADTRQRESEAVL